MKTFLQYVLIVTSAFISIKSLAQQPPNFNAAEAAGLVTYDADAVIKKLKVDDLTQKDSIHLKIHIYNAKIDQLNLKHSQTFEALDTYFEKQVRVAMRLRDRSQMDPVKQKIKETIPPIRMEVINYESELDAALKSILSEDQYKKWLKYQESRKPTRSAMMGG